MATSHSLQWKEIECQGERPMGRVGESLTTTDDAVFMYGGMVENSECSQYLDEFFVLHPDAARWERRDLRCASAEADSFTATAFHSCVTHNGRLHLFGGCSSDQQHNAVVRVDPRSATRELVRVTSNEAPAPRYCHSAVVFENAMYIFGGKSGARDSSERLADIFKFDFANQTWSHVEQRGDLPPPRSAHSAVVCGRKMFVVGGVSNVSSERGCCSDLYEFTFDTHMWRRIPDRNAAFERARHSAVLHNGVIAVFGGWNGKRKLNDLYLHALDGRDEDADTDPDTAPARRECHAAVMWKNTMLVFSGRHKTQALSDIQAVRLGPATLVEQARDWLFRANYPLDTRKLPPRLAARLDAWSDLHAIRN